MHPFVRGARPLTVGFAKLGDEVEGLASAEVGHLAGRVGDGGVPWRGMTVLESPHLHPMRGEVDGLEMRQRLQKGKVGQRVRFATSTFAGTAGEVAEVPVFSPCYGEAGRVWNGIGDRQRKACSHRRGERGVLVKAKGSRLVMDPVPATAPEEVVQALALLPRRAMSRPLHPDIHPINDHQPVGREGICWKCKSGVVVERIDFWWERSTEWCFWVCCGVEIDVDDDSEGFYDGIRGSGAPRLVLIR